MKTNVPEFMMGEFANQINWEKHFGLQFPLKKFDPPDWDRENYLEEIDFNGLVNITSSLRDGMFCEIVAEYFGHYNLVYRIQFEDGVQWIARIPLPFRLYESLVDKKVEKRVQRYLFESMVAAQIYARIKKGVFTPAIYGAFPDSENEVGVPFILLQDMDPGLQFNENIGHFTAEKLRLIFSDLAREMISLASPPYFTQIGCLLKKGEDYTIGPMLSGTSLEDDPIDLKKRGPYSTVQEYLISTLNRHIATALREQNRQLYLQTTGLRAIVSDFIDPRFNSGPFILCPFDWEARHIYLNSKDHVCGIIDWDFATIVPVQAFFRYPPFMTRDWIVGTNSKSMEEYRKLFRECLGELQDETELPLLELLDQSRWFQMLDEGIQNVEVGKQVLPLLEAYVAAMRNKRVEVKAIPVVSAVPQLKQVKGKRKVDV